MDARHDILDNIDPSWFAALPSDWKDKVARSLETVDRSTAGDKPIYPARQNIFRALQLTPLHDVRVVIIGQDPYHGPGQADGLSFSVQPGVRAPRSLQNIYKELQDDLGIPPSKSGCLDHWGKQGVLMLNHSLTVEHKSPGSHAQHWSDVTDDIVSTAIRQPQPIVFILWGDFAKAKAGLLEQIDHPHLVLTSPHPSFFSARKGFFGSRPFSAANRFLTQHGRGAIDWSIPSEQHQLEIA